MNSGKITVMQENSRFVFDMNAGKGNKGLSNRISSVGFDSGIYEELMRTEIMKVRIKDNEKAKGDFT